MSEEKREIVDMLPVIAEDGATTFEPATPAYTSPVIHQAKDGPDVVNVVCGPNWFRDAFTFVSEPLTPEDLDEAVLTLNGMMMDSWARSAEPGAVAELREIEAREAGEK